MAMRPLEVSPNFFASVLPHLTATKIITEAERAVIEYVLAMNGPNKALNLFGRILETKEPTMKK